jgi:cytochrome c peroxidase
MCRAGKVGFVLLLALASACLHIGGAPITRPELDPNLVQRGGMLFLDPRISANGDRSCTTCHPGAGTNGRAYRDGVEVEPGTPGARDVPALWGVWRTPPYMADGSMNSIAQVIDRSLAVEMGGGVLGEVDRRALEAYVLSIPPFDRRRTLEDGTPTEPVTRSALDGFAVYQEKRCDRCHPAPVYSRTGRFDVGTGGKYAVPSLRGVSQTAPYGHDGRWSTLKEAVRAILDSRDEGLGEEDLRRLVDYLQLL